MLTHTSPVPMATEARVVEFKTEANLAEANEEAVEENTEPPLKYKRWVLKVSVHCEGCKRKVKKILNNIEGVYTTDVELRQQKVTVLGNVDAETLIKKLVKTGKHAELWPDQNAIGQSKGKKKAKGKNKKKEKSKNEDHEIGGDGGEKGKQTVKFEVPQVLQDPSKASENGGGTTNEATVDFSDGNVCEASESGANVKPGGQGKEVKTFVKQTVILPAGNQLPAACNTGGSENDGGSEKSGGGAGGGGSGGQKKKKKGHNGNNGNVGEGEHFGDVPAGTGSASERVVHVQGQSQVMHPASHSSPRYLGYQYPPPPHYRTPPAYAVSYHTALPSTSYSASHYAPACSYAYMHPGPEPPPTDLDSNPSQSSDSFELFSDENPNACSLM